MWKNILWLFFLWFFFLPTQHIPTILYWTQTLYQYSFHTVNEKQKFVNVKFFKKKKENNSVYYFRERISLYSCDIVDTWLISTSHGLLNLQATIPSAISRFVIYAAALPVSIVEGSWFCCLHQIFIFEIHMKGNKKS